jgi:hypothetical protein
MRSANALLWASSPAPATQQNRISSPPWRSFPDQARDIVAAWVKVLPRIKRNPHVSDSHRFGKIIAPSAEDHKHKNFSAIDLRKVTVNCALAAKDNHCTSIFGRSEIGTDTQFRTYPLKAQ